LSSNVNECKPLPRTRDAEGRLATSSEPPPTLDNDGAELGAPPPRHLARSVRAPLSRPRPPRHRTYQRHRRRRGHRRCLAASPHSADARRRCPPRPPPPSSPPSPARVRSCAPRGRAPRGARAPQTAHSWWCTRPQTHWTWRRGRSAPLCRGPDTGFLYQFHVSTKPPHSSTVLATSSITMCTGAYCVIHREWFQA